HLGHEPGLAADAFERALQGHAVEDGGEHAHVVGGGLLDDDAAGAELLAAQKVARANDDGELHAAVVDLFDLLGNLERIVDADAALAGGAEAFTGELEQHAFEFGFQGVGRIFHNARIPYGSSAARQLLGVQVGLAALDPPYDIIETHAACGLYRQHA